MNPETNHSQVTSEETTESSEKLANFDYEVFKSFLIHSDEHPLHMEQLPNRIETGKIGDELNKMYLETDNDPERKERGSIVVRDVNNNVLISSIPIIGEKHRVEVSKPFRNRPPGSVLLILHTHPSDTIASPQDLSFIVAEERSSSAVNGMMTAVGGLNVLFMRTAETKTIPSGLLRKGWTTEAKRDMQEHYEEVSVGFTLFKRRQLHSAKQTLENNKIVGKICKKHNIAVYTSKPGETEFIRASLS